MTIPPLPFAFLGFLIAGPLFASPAQTPTDLTEHFVAPEGARVTLWAESPKVYNPTALDIDQEGRVWVTEAINYRRWGGRNKGFEIPGGDRVVVLQDTNGDGQADKSTVFAQDEDLVAPLGIAVVGEWIYVSCSPNLFRYRDTDGDLVADERELVLTGFGGLDHDHGLHSVVTGDDGFLYLSVGNAGPHQVDGPDGFQLRSGSIYTGGTPYNGSNTPGLVSSDGEVWTAGLNLRLRPDGSGLEVLAHNFRNQYEVTRDAYGSTYSADNDDDGSRGCRTVWAPEGANLGYFGFEGRTTWRADERPWQGTWTAHWHQDDPGVFPAGSPTGAGGPTGCALLEGTVGVLGAWNGSVLNCDAGAGVVYAHRTQVEGAAITMEGSIFLGRTKTSGRAADDGQGVWFRPSDVCVAPDGSVLVADWYDPGVGGHGAGDRETYGRLLRVSGPGQEGSLGERTAGASWDSPNIAVRAAAREDAAHLTNAWVQAANGSQPRRAARALAMLAGREQGPAATRRALNHPHERVRAAALRIMSGAEGPASLLSVAEILVDDPSPLVRALALRLLRTVDPLDKHETLLALTLRGPASDRTYLESIGLGARGGESELLQALMQHHQESTPIPTLLRKVAWRLQLEEGLPLLQSLAQDESLDEAARLEAVDGIAWLKSPAAADAMFALAHTGSAKSQGRAKQWLALRAGNLWRDHGLVEKGPAQMPSTASQALEFLRPTELTPVKLDVQGMSQIWLNTTDSGDGNSSDWADWLDVAFIDANGKRTPLSDQGWTYEETGWGKSRFGKNAAGGSLIVAGKTYEDGLGAHAPSLHGFEVPADAVLFTGFAGRDEGGTSQGSGSTIDFRVFVVQREIKSQVHALRSVALESGPGTVQTDAIRTLAQLPTQALWVAEQATEWNEELKRAALEGLEQNPDLGVRALARGAFQPMDTATPAVRPEELLALKANPLHGRQVFRSTAAQCSSCHALGGYGQDIGPNLSSVHEKYDRAGLLDAILNPSKAVSIGYETQIVATHDGEILSGFLLARDEHGMVLKTTTGERLAIHADEIEATRQSPVSLMPEGVALGLSPQELADLVAYLSLGPDLGRQLGKPVELYNGENFDGWLRFLPGGQDPDKTWSIVNGIVQCTGSPAGYLRTEASYGNYELEVEWRFDPTKGAGNSGVLLRMNGEDKVWPRSIEAQLHSGNAGDIWNIDKMVMQADPERTNGRRTKKAHPSAEKALGAWNHYRIVMDGPLMELWINGVLQNDAIGCEANPGPICLQSEGAYIEFRRVTLTPILD